MRKKYVVCAVTVALFTNAFATEYEIKQGNKKFSTEHLKIKVGDTVSFFNGDIFFHNIYSLSEVKTFDLGSYAQGQTRKVTFDQPGTVNIECAIHPYMKMTVEVGK